MIRQQPEGHDTFASGDYCFCAAKVAPVALSTITASVNWLSDKRYWFVRIPPSDGAIKSDRAKVVMTAGCISRTFDISNYIYIPREIGKIRIYKPKLNVSRETGKNEIPPPNFEGGISVYWTNICRKLSFYYRCDTS